MESTTRRQCEGRLARGGRDSDYDPDDFTD
jgi:hypothetical protein